MSSTTITSTTSQVPNSSTAASTTSTSTTPQVPNNSTVASTTSTSTTPQTPTNDTVCNGVPSTDWSCCTTSSPCDVGGGDCDTDSECVAGLQCGNNNCKRDYSSAGSSWSDSADCCASKSNIEISIFAEFSVA